MKSLLILAVALCTVASAVLANPAVKSSETNKRPNEILIFSDEFDTLNHDTWTHDRTMGGGGNWEFQLYHNNRSNSYVKDGVFHIKPTPTAYKIGEDNLRSGFTMDMWGSSPADACSGHQFYGCSRASNGIQIINPVQSAKITTRESFSFEYGRVEVRAKLPRGKWMWPAIWMLPKHNYYGGWPASGEIDIMEGRGNDKEDFEGEEGNNCFGTALHWGPDWSANRYDLTRAVYCDEKNRLSDEFHTYGLVWTKDGLFTYLDTEDNVVFKLDFTKQSMWELGKFPAYHDPIWDGEGNNAPFKNRYYLVINVAIGGTNGYFADGVGGKPWSDSSPTAALDFWNGKDSWLPSWTDEAIFRIDSVKVWSFI
jgi:beta-glucanase (GH16 family)